MKEFSFGARPFIRSLTFAVALSGCANGSIASPPHPYFAAPPTPAEPAAHLYGNDFMYSSRPSGNEVVVYKRKRRSPTLQTFETLTSGLSAPMGMVATPGARLYVANSGDSNVLVYRTTRKGPQGPVTTLNDDGEVPVDVAVTPDRGLVAVSNGATSGSGAGSVSVYLHRRNKLSRSLTYGSDPLQGAGIAVDTSGNCYWSFNDPTTLTGSVVEFTNCKGAGMPIVTGILKAGGLAFDQNENLYYVDQLAGIYKCTGLSQCTLVTGVGCPGCLVMPTNINFDNSSPPNLWVSDAAGYIDALDAAGSIEYTLQVLGGPTDPPSGIAPAPGG